MTISSIPTASRKDIGRVQLNEVARDKRRYWAAVRQRRHDWAEAEERKRRGLPLDGPGEPNIASGLKTTADRGFASADSFRDRTVRYRPLLVHAQDDDARRTPCIPTLPDALTGPSRYA